MKSLVLAEKPSVARDIARVLGCKKALSGAIEGEKYIVTWALGHLVTLADPEEYDSKYKEWKMEDLPMLPEKWGLVVIRQTSKQYQHVKAQLFRKDVGEIIIATDAGREGELVARWILEKAGCKKPIKRLWISSVTDKAIREGFANLKNGHDYDALYHAAKGRAKADWMVGINATRALTCKHNAQLSCGRVQTPTLAMIAHREDEIRAFSPREYFGLSCTANGITWTWREKKSNSHTVFDRKKVEDIQKTLKGTSLEIKEIHSTEKKVYSSGLYDLTQLQRDANIRYGFSAKETLNIMQRLYENHKVLTYPRTDSKYIGTDVVPTLKERLKACSIGPYKQYIKDIIRQPLKTNKSFVDNAKVSDHHAIIPTEEYVQLDHMTNEERKIYDLVVRRFISVFYPPFSYEQTTLTASAGNETFVAKGKIVKEIGWKQIFDKDDNADTIKDPTSLLEQHLPSMKEKMRFSITGTKITHAFTNPPARFTEASLLSAMENPLKFMQTKEQDMRTVIGETGGLGTVATRADIIEKLYASFLIEKRGNDLYITSKGKQLLSLVPEDLKQPELTASWEMQLANIAKGKAKESHFLGSIETYTNELIQEIKQGDQTFHHDNLTNSKCPRCGKRMLSVNGKNARLLVCQDRSCGYKETIARLSNARCPNCHKKMELIKKGEHETFICKCGYKEKLSSFKERRKKEGAGVSKKDVQKYLKKQQKETVNNTLASAFANIKLDQ